jgi:ribose transport system permease protein
MTAVTHPDASAAQTRSLLQRVIDGTRERPVIPLIFLLIGLLVLLEMVRPGLVQQRWIANALTLAIPLAILAASQTLTMLTGGIDLSVGIVASAAAFIVATQAPLVDPVIAVGLALGACALAGLVSGIGVGVFRVHPLIMTLAVGLIVVGLLQLYQRGTLGTGVAYPQAIVWLGAGLSRVGLEGFSIGVPNALLIFVPLALLIGFTLRRTGYGRLLYAIGDNEGAARLSGVRVWQVLVVLYVISALLAGIGGLLWLGIQKSPGLQIAEPLLLRSVAAAVIGGTSIFGGRGGYAGTIVGALILQVLVTLLTVLDVPEGMRRILFGLIILVVTALYVRVTSNR